ncbi:hypothetical protein BALOs_0117 [Halobacteriovorax sp. BALOs_7]|uniref:hypothetical protein n=1 Tax=Halobacteriovorax sp. BALOs_7 TaxID=2109558 RepID=UPI000EA1C1D8|nr:hypothetical protein [Halobacteriovorax sp. BALOs_7]AYF43138.1 hypothetical protein BALOs_0117 [Halobacteriovorax sp. BALOs_7]
MITLELGNDSFSLDGDIITLRQAISAVESDGGLSNNESITAVVIDGETYALNHVEEVLDNTLAELNYPSLRIQNSYEIAFEALDDCLGYIDQLLDKIIITTAEFNKSNIDEANLYFADLIEVLELYIHLITRIHATARKGNPEFFADNEMVKNLEIHLFSVIKALVPAREKNDIVMLSDLLEYELMDNLKQWKEKAIPLIQQSKINI